MEELVNCFNFASHDVVSIIGSGGKTSLMWYLAHKYSKEKVLVGTTTNIGFPTSREYDAIVLDNFKSIQSPTDGITVVGEQVPGKAKLRRPQGEVFPIVFSSFDKIFLECDGSKQLPLKGWADFEPVILEETTQTIGVIPISVIGKKVREDVVHRLPLFLEIAQCREKDEVTVDILFNVIKQSGGLWRESRGSNVLLLNQVDTDADMEKALELAKKLITVQHNPINRIVASNLLTNKGTILWKK